MTIEQLNNKYVDLITSELKRLMEENPSEYLEIHNICYRFSNESIFDMQDFNKVLKGKSPKSIVSMIGDSFCLSDKYFQLNCGKLESSNKLSDLIPDFFIKLIVKDLFTETIICDNKDINSLLKQYKINRHIRYTLNKD